MSSPPDPAPKIEFKVVGSRRIAREFTLPERLRLGLLGAVSHPAVLPEPFGDLSIPESERIAVVCTSDTHNTFPIIPDGDIFIHAGDLSKNGTQAEVQATLDWIGGLPHKHKIVIAGNHDKVLDPEYFTEREAPTMGSLDLLDWHDITYLYRASTTVTVRGRTLTIYGDPRTYAWGGYWAFQHPRDKDIWKDTVPDNVDVFVTHGPPKGWLDFGGKGWAFVTDEIRRAKPRLVVFGHIHEARGFDVMNHDDYNDTAREKIGVGESPVPGFIETAALASATVVSRAWSAAVGQPQQKQTLLVNAASLDRFGFRPTREQCAGVVVYM